MSEMTFTTAAVAVTSHERRSARLENTYDYLANLLAITPGTSSADVTDAARRIVIEGAANDKTATGRTLTVDDLTGRDPGADSKVRDYWKAARAVRIGLVSAAKRAAGEGDDDSSDPDYLARVVKAAIAAAKHEISADDIVTAVTAALKK